MLIRMSAVESARLQIALRDVMRTLDTEVEFQHGGVVFKTAHVMLLCANVLRAISEHNLADALLNPSLREEVSA